MLFLVLSLVSLLGSSILYANTDINGDAIVNGQDISKLASCFGQTPSSNTACAMADVDVDGDIDIDDYRYVSSRLGQTYPWIFYSTPAFSIGNAFRASAIGDVNGDGTQDIVASNYPNDNAAVLLGNGDGSFQEQRRMPIGNNPNNAHHSGNIQGTSDIKT